MLNQDILLHVVGFLDFDAARFLNLAQVNRLFYQVFTGDNLWHQYNVYGLKGGVYRHFVESLNENDKLNWRQIQKYKRRPGIFQELVPIIRGTSNKYIWLECFAADEFFASAHQSMAPVDLDRDFLVAGVRFSPALFTLCTGDLVNDREIAFNALTSKKSSLMNSGHFSRHSALASDREFCKLVIDRPTREIRGNLGYFTPEFAEDLELLALAFKWCPQAIFLAPQITREIVDLLIPTEAAFLPVIENYIYELERFMKFYNSARVIRTAVNGCTDEEELEELDQLWHPHLDLEARVAIQVYFSPHEFKTIENKLGLAPTMDTSLMALWSPMNYNERRLNISQVCDIYSAMSPDLQNNKELWYLFLRELDSTKAPIIDTLAQLTHPSSTLRDSILGVLNDPTYSTKLRLSTQLGHSDIPTKTDV